ncbi:hypothetical protein SLA2020_337690 [Shorea laevis]
MPTRSLSLDAVALGEAGREVDALEAEGGHRGFESDDFGAGSDSVPNELVHCDIDSPIKGYIDKVKEAAKKSSGREKLEAEVKVCVLDLLRKFVI